MKTIERASLEYANKYVSGCRDIYPANQGEFIDAFEAGVEFSKQWISVNDELPKKLVQVIVKLENEWHTCTWITENGDFAFNVKPTHWRYIDIE